MGDKWLNANFDKNMNSMKQNLHGPFKNFKLLGKQLIDVEKNFNNLLFYLKVVLWVFYCIYLLY